MTKPAHKRPDLQSINFHGFLTVEPKVMDIFELIKRVARTNTSVLIRGDTGTGKELMSRAIHFESRRRNRPFRAINCATLTGELLASELFGHVRGAFTGAVRDRKGLFSLADQGTAFLDEVAEIPIDLQGRLLRVLQEKTFVPLGGTDVKSVDVRFVSATHRSLRREVETGRFREDLMYRLRVAVIFLPMLAERQGDLQALLWRFIDEFNAEGFREINAISDVAMDAIRSYDWPGNVRELRNNVEAAFAMGEGPVLTLSELAPELRGEGAAHAVRGAERVTGLDLERERLVEALRICCGRKGEAAERLGMSRSTLWRKLREHDL
jgi:two-component system response regulator AtoC